MDYARQAVWNHFMLKHIPLFFGNDYNAVLLWCFENAQRMKVFSICIGVMCISPLANVDFSKIATTYNMWFCASSRTLCSSSDEEFYYKSMT